MNSSACKYDLLGGYKVLRLIGKGGMSEVYEVENPRLGTIHALKLFNSEKNDDEVLRRFQVEGRLLAKLNHPRIVKVIDYGCDEKYALAYFVMDLVRNQDGRIVSLADVQPGSVDEETVGRWYDDLRDALAYIHAKGVIHRDLKLQNVLIGPDGHAILTDFGISKIFEVDESGGTIVDTVQTILKIKEGRNLIMGSVGYMSPELEMGVAASVQSDWYALGVIVYKMLTGTWCDSRTDVIAALEGYEPLWRRIIPKLLHSNPNARECLSYAQERRLDMEKAQFEAEERYLCEKERGHKTRHRFRYAMGVLSIISAMLVYFQWSAQKSIKRFEAELAVPTFETVFSIPESAQEEESEQMPSIEQFRAAMVDALVLTQGVFADLKEGIISIGKAQGEMRKMLRKAKNDDMDLFAGLPESYSSSGETAALAILLKDAILRMK